MFVSELTIIVHNCNYRLEMFTEKLLMSLMKQSESEQEYCYGFIFIGVVISYFLCLHGNV